MGVVGFTSGRGSSFFISVLVASGLLSTLLGFSSEQAAMIAFRAGPNGQSNLSLRTLVW